MNSMFQEGWILMRGSRDVMSSVLLAVLLCLCAGPGLAAGAKTAVPSKPRFTIVEDFNVADTFFNNTSYDNLKRSFESKGWMVDARHDETGRTICAVAQVSDALMIVSHGGYDPETGHIAVAGA